jgi:AraC-like DNA-binding protein
VALSLLRETDMTVTEVATRVGYTETSSFTKAFKRWTGTTPAAVIRESRGSTRHFVGHS